MADSKKPERLEKIKKIIGSTPTSEILLRVLEADGDKDVTSTFPSLYVNNRVVLLHYFKQEGSFGFLPDMKEAVYQFHRQKSGNCFLHGPSIFLPYLAQSQGVDNFSAVDISKFVRRSFTDEDLYDYVSKDDGGPSVDILETLLKPFKEIESHRVATTSYSGIKVDTNFDLKKEMGEAGPGLVHGFQTHKNFNGRLHPTGKTGYLRFNGPNNAKGHFVEVVGDGKEDIEMELETFLKGSHYCSVPQPRNLANDGFSAPTSTSTKSASESQDSGVAGNDMKKGKATEDTHAMVLIGGRQDKKENVWLLLQNWWDEMQFVEVSTRYFRESQGKLLFVDDHTILKNANNAAMENSYEMNNFRVSDANNLDRADAKRGLGHIEARDRVVVRTN
jgi:hypothetical protein